MTAPTPHPQPGTQPHHAGPLTALTIGNFDGAHLGHAELIRRARLAVGPEGRVIALAFHPHPATVLAPDHAPEPLTSFDQRARLLEALGVNETHQLEPTPDLLATPPDRFIRHVCERFRPAVIVEGHDFRFGNKRAGTTDTLQELGHALARENLGFETIVVDPISVPLSNATLVTASSTIVRWLIARGRTTDAARVLGRPHLIEGTVVKGDQRGRTIGVPTANLDTTNPLPADGVYAALADLPDGSTRPAALHVGPRETFNNTTRTLEAHILDWAGPDTSSPDDTPTHAYGWTISIQCLAYLRDQARYDSVESLVTQMNRDIARTRSIAAACTARGTAFAPFSTSTPEPAPTA